MDFYLHLLNDYARMKDENPSIGIILCADKDDVVVEYALRGVRNPMGVTEYRLTTKLPKQLRKTLPDTEMLKKRIKQEL